LKDVGKAQVFDARPPFTLLKTLNTGPITNHVNFVLNSRGMFAYVTVGGLNEVQIYRTDDFNKVATVPVGKLPHGIWPSGDGSRVYVGLENDDQLVAIDTLSNAVIATVPIGQAPQALVYVPNAVPEGAGTDGLQPLGLAGEVAHLSLARITATRDVQEIPTSVSLFDQGLSQVLEASVTGLLPGQSYVLALSTEPKGGGSIEPLAVFTTNPVGSAIVNAVGPIRQIVQSSERTQRRYLVILQGTVGKLGAPVQVQAE
jgi:YVTN family beta-propeller protein